MLSREERKELLAKLDEYRSAVENHVVALKAGSGMAGPDSWAKVMNAYANVRTLVEHDIS